MDLKTGNYSGKPVLCLMESQRYLNFCRSRRKAMTPVSTDRAALERYWTILAAIAFVTIPARPAR
jgi:hypothetical protein